MTADNGDAAAGEAVRGEGRVGVVIVAGGEGSRIGGAPKQFRDIGGHPMLAWSCATFAAHPAVDEVIVVLPSAAAERPPAWLADFDLRVTPGGTSRRASVHAGLGALAPDVAVVLIHDAARPFVSPDLVGRLVGEAHGGPVIPVLPLVDAIKRMRTRSGDADGVIETTLERDRLRAAQTPQAFPAALIRRLHDAAASEDCAAADDAALCERAGIPVRTIVGERSAMKITLTEDLDVAEWLVASRRVTWPGTPRGAA